LITVISGIIGARIYFVAIEWRRFFGPGGTWYHIFYLWQGGLGIWGGVTCGALAVFLVARHYKFNFLVLADCIAPGLALAQGVGRLGNYWNQELYGRPTDLPWGLEIAPANRVPGFETFATFHPTFLYEMVWNLALGASLLLVSRRRRLGPGRLFTSYVLFYAIGRSLVESFRIDPVEVIHGWRINSLVTLVGGVVGLLWLIWLVKWGPKTADPVTKIAARPLDGEAELVEAESTITVTTRTVEEDQVSQRSAAESNATTAARADPED
jgi:prolipoprotein diacylglyceryl transferase